MKNKKDRVIYYRTFEDDVVVNKNQDKKLSENYKWIHSNIIYRIFSHIIFIFAWIFGMFYCRFVLNIEIRNKEVLKKHHNTGCFLYGNHTQPVGDVFIPACVSGMRRIYVVVSPANLGLPIIGPLLPLLGALPIPDSISGMKKFMQAVHRRAESGKCVVVYPEAHVWPYYTNVRPFLATSFRFPVDCNVPAFCMTTTYQQRKYGRRPKTTVYIDGPFVPDLNLGRKERQNKLRDEIFECMTERSKSSTYEYIQYKEETS